MLTHVICGYKQMKLLFKCEHTYNYAQELDILVQVVT